MDRATKIVVEMLAKGNHSQAQIADLMEVSESAISQVATKYADIISERTAEATISQQGRDAKLDGLEDNILDKLMKQLPFETDIKVLTGMLKVVNSAHRRGKGETPITSHVTNVAHVQLPTFITNNISYTKSPQGEIVEVDGRNLATASLDTVNQLAIEHKEAEDEELLNDFRNATTSNS